MIHIAVPIWSTRSVGIALDKIYSNQTLIVKIDYVDRFGNESFPYLLRMIGAKALTYPSQTIKGRIIKIIPIEDFERVVEKSDIKYKIHQKLEKMYPKNKLKQYSLLRKETGKNHVTDLSVSEAEKFFATLERNKLVSQETWKLL